MNGGHDFGDHILQVNYLPCERQGPIHDDRRIAFRLRGAATAVSCSARESGIRRAKAAGAGSHSLLLLFCLYCPFEISRRVGGSRSRLIMMTFNGASSLKSTRMRRNNQAEERTEYRARAYFSPRPTYLNSDRRESNLRIETEPWTDLERHSKQSNR